MVGPTAILAILGIGLGFTTGLWWGFSQSWLWGITASVGGAIAGGIIGCIAGFILQEVPNSIDKFSKTHRVLGNVLLSLFCLLVLAGLVAFYYAGHIFLQHIKHHGHV
jgi:ABC-type dipeptide/oligopeptide/nickel transport system permease subunit